MVAITLSSGIVFNMIELNILIECEKPVFCFVEFWIFPSLKTLNVHGIELNNTINIINKLIIHTNDNNVSNGLALFNYIKFDQMS